MTARQIAHVDMDAFYASVEQRDHPECRGKPVIVGADPKEGKGRGVVAACSYEARKFGIHSAMPISRAFKLCPDGIYLSVRMWRYEEVSESIFAIFRHFSDMVEGLSIDEAFLDVTRSQQLFGPAETIARKMKAEIFEKEGLVASVGLAPNKFLAKLASDLSKPNGFLVVSPDQIADFLHPLPISRLWGVGEKSERRLQSLGLTTVGELANWSRARAESLLGKSGGHLWELSQGIDDRPVEPNREAKSIGSEMTFVEDTDNPEVLRRTLLSLADRVSRRLRQQGYEGFTVTLKYRTSDFLTITRSTTFGEPTQRGSVLYQTVLELLEKIPNSRKKVRLLGITVSNLLSLDSPLHQLKLFDSSGTDKNGRVESVVDQIKERFGEEAITRAALLPRGDEEP